MGFFKTKQSATDLAGELIANSGEWALKNLNKILALTGNTSPDSIQTVQTGSGDFAILWAFSTCILGNKFKSGDASRLCAIALSLLEQKYPNHKFGSALAEKIVERASRSEDRWSSAAAEMFSTLFPTIKLDAAFRVPGIDLVTSTNYADFLVSNYKVQW